jgi:hypothetical protein
VDHFTKYYWLFPIHHKNDVRSIFIQLKGFVEKQFGFPIKNLYSDNDDKYQSLCQFLSTQSINMFTTAPHTPQQNSTSERRHRHIVETGLTLLHQAHLPVSYWTHAFQTAVYLINRMPTSILNNKSPFEIIFGRQPNYHKLRTFECQCFPWLKPYNHNKLQPKSKPCIFIGYSSTQNAYKCMDIHSSQIYISKHVVFDETIFPYTASTSMSSQPHAGNPTIVSTIPIVPPSGQTPSMQSIVTTTALVVPLSAPPTQILVPPPAPS